MDLHPKALARDEHFKDYQEMSGSALAAVSSTLNDILCDSEEPIDSNVILDNLSSATKILSHLFYSLTESIKVFFLRKYDERIQKILKKSPPTTLLFGVNLRALIDSSKAMESVSKDLKTKSWFYSEPKYLYWKSSAQKREVTRGSYNQQRSYISKASNSNSRRRWKAPTKKFYLKPQPQRNRR